MSDEELRLHAMQMAIGYITKHIESEFDLTPLAQEIYRFIKGETSDVNVV